MRVILIVAVLAIVVLGASFAALNAAPSVIDFYFFQIHPPTGLALLASVLAGWLLGGLVAWLGQVPRLRRQLREAQRRLRESTATVERDGP